MHVPPGFANSLRKLRCLHEQRNTGELKHIAAALSQIRRSLLAA
jgi:hypothetical protein